MTPAEQIAYLRNIHNTEWSNLTAKTIIAVCDLAERALDLQTRLDAQIDVAWQLEHSLNFERERHRLTDDETEAVRSFLRWFDTAGEPPINDDEEGNIAAVLRRLIGEA